jgi:folate-binding protein YgfZ
MEDALREAGAVPLSTEAREVLRIEAGTPVFGKDMSEETIPVEAGIHLRAVDYQKGCYTGQEFIIRLRDRGKVNKTFRRILLGEAPVPEPGTELFCAGRERSRGWVTSACVSPRFGQTVALGYVKRGLGQEEEKEIRLGSIDGPPGRVEAL